jgi:hypothetical protein
MRRILCLALPVLLAAACGDSGGENPNGTPDAGKPDVAVPDSPLVADAPAGTEVQVEQPPPIDGPRPIDTNLHPDDPIDAPQVKDDAPLAIDGPRGDHFDPAPIDAPPTTIDAVTRTLWSPDGRSWTVIMVPACDGGALGTGGLCPPTYAEGLAKAKSGVDGGYGVGTAAGRCAEGSYIYRPYISTEGMGCYYDATGQKLVGYMETHDTTSECGQDGTASNSWAHGTVPPCTNITWDVLRVPY